MTRRIAQADTDDALEAHVAVMWPERWQQLYGTQSGDYGHAFGGEIEVPITDPADLDEWFGSIAAQRGMSGAEAAEAFSPLAAMGWAEGSGVKV